MCGLCCLVSWPAQKASCLGVGLMAGVGSSRSVRPASPSQAQRERHLSELRNSTVNTAGHRRAARALTKPMRDRRKKTGGLAYSYKRRQKSLNWTETRRPTIRALSSAAQPQVEPRGERGWGRARGTSGLPEGLQAVSYHRDTVTNDRHSTLHDSG